MTTSRRTVCEDDLARLKQQREAADRRYNEALTALDAAMHVVPDLPHPPPAPDETQVTPLNTCWEILGSRPAFPAGWRGRLAAFVWDLIEPTLATQQAFNSALVDHVNRNIESQREIPRSIKTTIAVLQEQVEQVVHFQSRLIVYLQQITPYVDTKDYEFAGLGRRVAEDAREVADQAHEELKRLDRTARGLAAGISGVSDEMLKRWESLLARDQRYDGRINELRTGLAVAQQQSTALKRVFERIGAAGLKPGPAPVETSATAAEPASAPTHARSSSTATAGPGFRAASTVESWKYVGFEDLFRGSREEIRERVEGYVPIFEGARDVLDVGCGRGEFLDLLTDRGITARGLDINHEMVEGCRSRGLDVIEADALEYLRGLPDGSLGGLFAAQVVEHLEPDYLLQFLDQAQRALRPNAPLVLETINAACWLAFFESYIRDLTHARPLHPDTLKYLVTASGFVDAEIRFAAPVPPADRLQPAPRALRQIGPDGHPGLGALADTFDGNVERLNRLMFTDLDYAVIARHP